MLLLKLLLVPAALLALSLIGRHFGPSVVGWLAGLPVVIGPILLVLALENGAAFASNAATSSMAGIFASMAFSLSYAHAAGTRPWFVALHISLLVWFVAACALVALPSSYLLNLVIGLCTLLLAPRAFPSASSQAVHRDLSRTELLLRMAAGAALTLAVSAVASTLGSTTSGLLAVFPVLTIVLAVFSHRANGASFASTLLRAMVTGLYSLVAFCAVLSPALQHTSIPIAFTVAVVAALAVQVGTSRRLTPRSSGEPTA